MSETTSLLSACDVQQFSGYVEFVEEALRVVYATSTGALPRVLRHPTPEECQTLIRSGAVFVFSVAETGLNRWVDGLLWGPGRIDGNFLVYREIRPRGAGTAAPLGTDMMKKNITFAVGGCKYHLVCYYTPDDVPRLARLASRADIAGAFVRADAFALAQFRVPVATVLDAQGRLTIA